MSVGGVEEENTAISNQNDLGYGFHYLLKCAYFEVERKQLLKPYYYTRPNIIKLK